MFQLSKTFQYVPTWSKTINMVQNGPKGVNMVQFFPPKLSKIVQNCPNLPKIIKNCPKLSKMVQNGPIRISSFVFQMGPAQPGPLVIFLLLYHEISRNLITKPPGTFIAGKAA